MVKINMSVTDLFNRISVVIDRSYIEINQLPVLNEIGIAFSYKGVSINLSHDNIDCRGISTIMEAHINNSNRELKIIIVELSNLLTILKDESQIDELELLMSDYDRIKNIKYDTEIPDGEEYISKFNKILNDHKMVCCEYIDSFAGFLNQLMIN